MRYPKSTDLQLFIGILSVWIPALLFAVVVIAPIFWVALNGWTLTGTNEESVGIRYFNSLRALYDPPTYLFVPQGQTIDLLNKLIQLLLTAIGLPPTQLFPRIDYFSYISVAAMQAFNVACFVWMALAIPRLTGQLVAGIIWLGFIVSKDFSFIYGLFQPDYFVVEPGIALLAAGAILRTAQGVPLSPRRLASFSAMIAFALATKFTLVLFPAAAFGHALLLERSWTRAVTLAAIVGGLGIAGCFVAWFVDFGFNADFLILAVRQLIDYVKIGGGFAPPTSSWPEWLLLRVSEGPVLKSIVYAMPVLSAASLLLITSWRRAALILPLFVAVIVSSFLLYKRDYPITLMEAALLTPLFGWCVASEIALPLVPTQWRRYAAATIFLLFIPAMLPSFSIISSIAISNGHNTIEQSFLPSASSEGPRQLWLIPENADRPLSVHSAIMKGGGGSDRWLNPDSPIMRRMFPNLSFGSSANHEEHPIELENYDNIYFTFSKNLMSEVARISKLYGLDLSFWKCEEIAPISVRMVAVCHR